MYPLQLSGLISLAQLPQAIVLFLLQVGLLLDLGFVEAIDDGVLALGDEDTLDLWKGDRLSVRVLSCGVLGMGGVTFRGSLKLTWPTSMLPSFFRLDQGV